ncbi:hypothetical protein J6590_061774 [Homalodisca vitripennis]|nr:hypothetical protein J6590_061774 [Homalodisca vitripennis]
MLDDFYSVQCFDLFNTKLIEIDYRSLFPNAMNINKSGHCCLLHEAVEKCSIEKLESLLDIAPKHINVISRYRRTLLHCAIDRKFEQGVCLLLERGADVNIPDASLHTPLHYCCWGKNENILKLLLDRGSDIHFRDHGKKTALHIAVTYGFITGVNMLIESGADLDVRDREGNTPLIFAVRMRNQPLIETLVSKGASLNIANNKGYTALHLAAKYTDGFIVGFLLDNGAEINCRDDMGCTPLHLVHSNKAVVRLLLQRGAGVNIRDCMGCTPLHVVLQGMMDYENDVVEELLDWGSCMNIRDIDGETPLATANKQMISVDGMKRHIIKLQYANLPLEFNCSIDLSDFESYQLACLDEVAKLKINRFGWNSLFDVFSKHVDPTFVLNDGLQQAIKSPLVEKEFPIYCSLLRSKFEHAVKRVALLDTLQNILDMPLPNEIIRKILSYLDNRHLEYIVKDKKERKPRRKGKSV